MRTVKIKDIGEVVSGATPKTNTPEYWNGNIPWVTPKEISKLSSPFLKSTERNLTQQGFKSCSARMLPVNSILLTSRAPIGLLAINEIEVCTNQGFKSIIFGTEVHPQFIYFLLKFKVPNLKQLGTGTTFKELSKRDVENFEIDLPHLAEQIKIAHVLKKVEDLIEQRKESINLLDELVRNTFLEMFGDPASNSKKIGQISLGDLGSWKSGGTPLRSNRSYFGGEINWATSGELNDVYISKTNEKITELALKESNAKLIEEGSLLLGMYDTAALKSSISIGSMSCNQAIAYAKLDNTKCNTLFVYYLIQIGKEEFKKVQRGARQKNMNLGMIKDIPILNPSLKKQNEFGELAELVFNQNEIYCQSLTQLENLYNSLSQKAFKGKLDLSKLKTNDSDFQESNSKNDSLQSIINQSKNHFRESTKAITGESGNVGHIRHEITKKEPLPSSVADRDGTKLKTTKPKKTLQEEKEFIEKRKKEVYEFIEAGFEVFDVPMENRAVVNEYFDNRLTYAMISKWILEEYRGYHFTMEMLLRFCTEEKEVYPHYFSSKELKDNRKADVSQDIKSMIFDSLQVTDPDILEDKRHLKLEQVFYDGERENFDLRIRKEDFNFIKEKTPKERSGIYLKVKE